LAATDIVNLYGDIKNYLKRGLIIMKSYIKLKSAFFYFILLVFFLPLSFVSAKSPTEINTMKILTKAKKVYGNIVSYTDSGTVKTKIVKIKFKTCYTRPNSFLFKWVSYRYKISPKTLKEEIFSKSNAVLAYGTSAYNLYDYKNDSSSELIKEKSIREAISRSYGISYGSAGIIPSLIFEDSGSRPITALENPVLLGYEVAGGKNCFHIMGNHARTMAEYHLWIGKDDYLIRKIIRNSRVGVIEIIYDNVDVNVEIPQTVFNLEKLKEEF